jgi:hypothetical protein
MATPKYHDEFGTEFDGPFGVGTFLGDDITSYPDEPTAIVAGHKAVTQDDHTATVYGPQVGTRRARKITTIKWGDT